MKLDKNITGIVFGLFLAVLHAAWSLLVFSGWAGRFTTWIFGLHFLSNPFVFLKFDFLVAVELAVIVFIFGYIYGWVFGWLWNILHRRR